MSKTKDEIVQTNLAEFYQTGAPYVTARSVGIETFERYGGLAPEPLLELWRAHGFGTSHGGLVQFCDPESHAGTLAAVFGDDSEFRPEESFVFAYTAFGKLLVWNVRWQQMDIDLVSPAVIPFRAVAQPPEDGPLIFSSTVASLGSDYCDRTDARGRKLYDRAVKTLGVLEYGQVYGFVPALVFGGSPDLSNLRRLSAPEHFSILAQAANFDVLDASKFPPRLVRTLA